MEVSHHPDIKKDFKKLKRYPSAKQSLEAWIRLFCVKGLAETPGIDPYNDFGAEKIYKARVIPLQENVGKAHGYRLVFQMKSEQECHILIFSRHGIYKHEKELIALIKQRLQ